MTSKTPIWSMSIVKDVGRNNLLIKDYPDQTFRTGVSVEFNQKSIKCVSEAEDWLNFSEDQRDLEEAEIMRLANKAEPLEYYSDPCLFSGRMAEILRRLNITSLQFFAVDLVHPYTGRKWSGYSFVNVIGRIDKAKPMLLKMARNESTLELLIDTEVKTAIEALKLSYLQFTQQYPAKW